LFGDLDDSVSANRVGPWVKGRILVCAGGTIEDSSIKALKWAIILEDNIGELDELSV